MKRTLINQETLDAILSESAYKAEFELKEAEDVLAKTLGVDYLGLHSFDESRVVYKNPITNSYIHASYNIARKDVVFENVEELVVDEQSKRQKARQIVSDMLEAVYENNVALSKKLLKDYLALSEWGKGGDELDTFKKKKKKAEDKDRLTPPSVKKSEKGKKEGKKEKFLAMIGAAKKNKDKKSESLLALANNVLEYVDFIVNGPTLENTAVQRDEKGNVTAVRMPNSKLRNESKLISFNWGEIGNGLKKQRENAMHLTNNRNFCETIAQLRTANAMSDTNTFEEGIEAIIKNCPEVLYVTQEELAGMVKEALDALNVTSYDDKVCQFIAEGILRNAHDSYSDRVNKIISLAGANKANENEDPYVHFQEVAEKFYESVDEQFGIQTKVFADLYEALIDIYKSADRRGDEALKAETSRYLDELKSVLEEQVKPDLELAQDTANFIMQFVETNLGSQPWTVSNTPHVTVTGDHPAMAEKAKKGYSPAADFSGNWGDPLPQIGPDDMNYKSGKYSKETRNNSWGQEGGKEIFPSLSNPYVPKPFGDYTMKGEKGVDKANDATGTWSSGDTWPNLQNPYVPKAETPKTYKMNHGKEKDLVVDK
jgi:hypothetical protein